MANANTTPADRLAKARAAKAAKKVAQENDLVVDTKEMTIEEERAAMQNQIRYQMSEMMKMAERMGMKLDDMFEKPPVEDTVLVEDQTDGIVEEFEDIEEVGASAPKPKKSEKLLPGTAISDKQWVPWRKEDMQAQGMVTFIPETIPQLVHPLGDDEGRDKILLSVNGLGCWLTCGVNNTVSKPFYDAYMDSYNSWRELEKFKRTGPSYAPWGARGPDGRPAWSYTPQAVTYGLDIDGKYLTSARNPLLGTSASTPPSEGDGTEPV